MRLIDADALIEEALTEGAYGYVDAKQIADAPTVDASPVRHGHWETNSDKPDTLICSVCKCGYAYRKSVWCDSANETIETWNKMVSE